MMSFLFVVGLSAWPAVQAPAATASHPCSAAEFRQFDFWTGRWDVFGPAGKLAGHNTIASVQGGCALAENWTGADGGTGMSLNFYDPADRRWHQSWMGSEGGALRLVGGLKGSAMVLASDPVVRPGGTAVVNRITWTPLADGTVHQLWEVSRDGGRGWQVVFDGKYVRAPARSPSNVEDR
jgi:hypothetical protein